MATAANTVHKLQKTSYVDANNTMVHNSDVIVKGNLTIVGGQTYAQTSTLVVKDNIITLNAAINQSGVPLFDAGIEVDRGSEQNVALLWKESEGAWKFTNDGLNYETLGGGSAGSYANAAFLQANAAYAAANNVAPQVQPAFDKANSAALYANGAFAQANAAFQSANNVAPQVQPAFDKANAAYAFANTTTAWGTRASFVATAGQTTFTPGSGYLPGYIDVYYNGVKLYAAEDFTATDGINVTLSSPATVNSIIEIVGFGANVPVANVYVLNSMASLLNRQTFFATAGQTTFTPTQKYRVGYVDVYYNGMKMVVPDDVIANNGTSIYFVGLTPTTNDVIEIVGLTPNVALANAIPITGGTVSGGLTLAGNVLPTSDNTYYLGSETNRWHSLFVGPGSIYIGGLKLSNSNGVLSVATPGQPATPIAGEDTWVRTQANAAFLQANASFNSANNVAPQIQPAFTQANAAYTKANAAAVYDANTTSTGYFSVPIGTTAQRPAAAANGSIRYNTSLGRLETYLYSGGWTGIIGDQYDVEYLIVAGGGSGGSTFAGTSGGGGGGAGGYRSSVTGETSGRNSAIEPKITVLSGTVYTITVGAGGTAAPGPAPSYGKGSNGSNSSIVSSLGSSIVSLGGGAGGGNQDSNYGSGAGGGSGGGAGGLGGTTTYAGAGTSAQGYDGGAGPGYSAPNYGSAGGGGAAGAGQLGSTTTGGNGGLALYSSISGANTSYAGGGGGGTYNGGTPGLGGGTSTTANKGGAGNGATATTAGSGSSNSGGGGGGAGGGGAAGTGGAGGSGIVIIRYTGGQRGTGGVVTSSNGYTIHTFTGSGTFIA